MARIQKKFHGKSRTQQQFKDETNIVSIMKRYRKTRVMPVVRGNMFDNFTGFESYHEAMNKITEAKQEFMRLPPKLRLRFENDPGQLIQFVQDPKNEKECIELGFKEAPKTPKPQKVEIVSSPDKPKGSDKAHEGTKTGGGGNASAD